MTRDEFIDWLTQAVDLNLISVAYARELRRRYDAGEFDERELALPLQERIRTFQADDNREALLLLLGLLGHRGTDAQEAEARFVLRGLSRTRRRRLLRTLQQEFEAEASRLATRLARTGDVRTWHRDMQQLVTRHTLEQANLGAAGRVFPQSYRQQLDQVLRFHTGRLSRYADQVAIRQVQENPFSDRYLTWRSQQYAGAGRGEFFRANEVVRGRGAGWVVDYIAVDDTRTCSPCSTAARNGPYLEGQGPMPGAVCLGRNKCRCRRERRQAPAAYDRLVGEAA